MVETLSPKQIQTLSALSRGQSINIIWLSKTNTSVLLQYAESARFAAEAVSAIRTVSSLTLEDKVAKTYGDMLDITVKRAFKHIAISMFFFGLAESLDLMGMISSNNSSPAYLACTYNSCSYGTCILVRRNTTLEA